VRTDNHLFRSKSLAATPDRKVGLDPPMIGIKMSGYPRSRRSAFYLLDVHPSLLVN
jgi:hypothetical protein